MPTYAIFPTQDHLRRPDGIGFACVTAADANAARARVAVLMDEPAANFAQWGAVDLATMVAPFVVQGNPVGPANQTQFPTLTRGGDRLRGA